MLKRQGVFSAVNTGEVVLGTTPVDPADPYASLDHAPGKIRIFDSSFNPPTDPLLASAKLWYSDGTQWLTTGTGVAPDADLVSQAENIVVYVSSGGSDGNTVSDKGDGLWNNFGAPVLTVYRALEIVREIGYNITAEILILDGETVNMAPVGSGATLDLSTGIRGERSSPLVISSEVEVYGSTVTITGVAQSRQTAGNMVELTTNRNYFDGTPITNCGQMLQFPNLPQPNKFVVVTNLNTRHAYIATGMDASNFGGQTAREVIRNGTITVNERVRFVGGKNVLFKNLNFVVTNTQGYSADTEQETCSQFSVTGSQIRINNVSIVNASANQPLFIGINDSSFYSVSSADYDGVGLDNAGLFIDGLNGNPGVANYDPYAAPDNTIPRTVVQVNNSSVNISGITTRGYVEHSYTDSYVAYDGFGAINSIHIGAFNSTLVLNYSYFDYTYAVEWTGTEYITTGNFIDIEKSKLITNCVMIADTGGVMSGTLNAVLVKFIDCDIDITTLCIQDTGFTKTNSDTDVININYLTVSGCKGALGHVSGVENDACYITHIYAKTDNGTGVSISNSDLEVTLNLASFYTVNTCVPVLITSSSIVVPDKIYVRDISSDTQAYTGLRLVNTRYFSDSSQGFQVALLISNATLLNANIYGMSIENCRGVGNVWVVAIGDDGVAARGTGAILLKNSTHHGQWINGDTPTSSCNNGVILQSGSRITGTAGSDMGFGSNALTVGSLDPAAWGSAFVSDFSGPNATGCFASSN